MVLKSQRQYAHNGPAQRRARKLADAKGLPMPSFIEPALATLKLSPPKGEQWEHEIKYDGYRFQAHVREGQDRERKVRFLTRRGYDWSARLASLRAPVASLKTHAAILDGEVVVQREGGATDFNELEREISKKGGSPRLVFYVFDLLHLDGLDLRRAPLIDRKAVLADLLATLDPGEPVKFSEHLETDGAAMRQRACEMGLEGIVSKRKTGIYQSGRTDHWIKAPCKLRDTFVIVGWAQKGSKFDGFYLGEERGGKLVYAGKIEGGWTEEQKQDLLARVKPLKRRGAPVELPEAKSKAHWVEPRLLVDAEYRARTARSGLLRHPRYKGMREDLM
jgi:bifunctional non-homologous end joining protein LigD